MEGFTIGEDMSPRRWRVLVLLAVTGAVLGFHMPALAHEPIFGLGPHVIFKGGVGIETEVEIERASGGGESESDVTLHTEILYGVTENFGVTLVLPTILDREHDTGVGDESSSGIGDLSLRMKWRFWRQDKPGIQNSAAVLLGVKLPTGDPDENPPLGSGSTDLLFGLAAAHESRRWYYFGDIRYRLNTEGEDNIEVGDRFFADVAIGIRPRLSEYLEPDLVLLTELNWISTQKSTIGGSTIDNSGGDQLFVSPGFFFTYRNWAVKGGVQIPVFQNLNGDQVKDNYRFALAFELHI